MNYFSVEGTAQNSILFIAIPRPHRLAISDSHARSDIAANTGADGATIFGAISIAYARTFTAAHTSVSRRHIPNDWH